MSTSPQPKVEGSPADGAVATPVLEGDVLRITADERQDTKLVRKIVPLLGSCPEEGPFWKSSGRDNRSLAPKTLRFECHEPGTSQRGLDWQDSVRAALWTKLDKLLSGLQLPEALPRVIFYDQDSTTGGLAIDLVFPSAEALKCAFGMCVIDIRGSGPERITFEQTLSRNLLPRDIFPIDCLGVPLEEIGAEAILAAFKDMTSDLGSLVGIAKFTVRREGWSLDTYSVDEGVIRAYLKLEPSWLAAPLDELAAELPSHLLWSGTPYKLRYMGSALHKETLHSVDYALHATTENSPSAASSSSHGDAAESARASKRRRTGKR